MTPTHLELTRRCPACGAVVEQREGKCWLCARPLAAPAEAPTPAFRSRAPSGEFQFSLGTLFLVMTLIAVHLGLLVALPPLGMPLLVVGMLALVRTAFHLRRVPEDQSLLMKVEVWFVSLISTVCAMFFGLVVWSLCALLLFGLVSLPGAPRGGELLAIIGLVGLAGGGLAGFVAFAFFYWMTLPPGPLLDDSPGGERSPARKTGTSGKSATV